MQSKWGQDGVYTHHPRDVPAGYNSPGSNPTFESNGKTYEARVYFRYDPAKAFRNDPITQKAMKPASDNTRHIIDRAPAIQTIKTPTYTIKPIK